MTGRAVPDPATTVRAVADGGPPGPGGYRRLVAGRAAEPVVRTDLASAPAQPGTAILTIAHLSDIHVCDHQSPARVEFLDRWADPDSPLLERLEEVGTYRAQELLTTQVAEAMVRAVNGIGAGPVGGRPVDLAIATGDNTDNAQANELGWYLSLLEGGDVLPDSGDRTRYEGVADDVVPDERFWHPHGGPGDLPRTRFGFPEVPGLLDAARAPFRATGLAMPWLAVHGNHDRLLQGTVPGLGRLAGAGTGSGKPTALPPDLDADAVFDLLAGLAGCDPSALRAVESFGWRTVTADPDRRLISRAEFVAAHFGPRSSPPGHGFTGEGPAHYRHDHGPVTLLVLDTVDEHGGWQGSLDAAQFAWLRAELALADAERRYVVLASHHPCVTLVNDTNAPGEPPRVLAAEVEDELRRHACVILWLNGHTHATTVTRHDGWWEVTAPSLIDWPQQGRVVEVLRSSGTAGSPGTITIAASMLEHAGQLPWSGSVDDPIALAGLSRELAANDWQWRRTELSEHPRGGRAGDRDVLLHLHDPWPDADRSR